MRALATAEGHTDEGPQPNPRPPAQPVAGEGAGDSTGAAADADGAADEQGARHGEYDAEMRAALLNRVSGSFAAYIACACDLGGVCV